MKYYEVDWVDRFNYEHYPSWETEKTLEKKVKRGQTNMQEVWSKKEITKEEYKEMK